jgi:hypothetical protein
MPPAMCTSAGQCACPTSAYTLVNYALDETQQTCECPGNPFVYYNGSACVNAAGITWLLLYFNYKNTSARTVVINPTGSTNIGNEV